MNRDESPVDIKHQICEQYCMLGKEIISGNYARKCCLDSRGK